MVFQGLNNDLFMIIGGPTFCEGISSTRGYLSIKFQPQFFNSYGGKYVWEKDKMVLEGIMSVL